MTGFCHSLPSFQQERRNDLSAAAGTQIEVAVIMNPNANAAGKSLTMKTLRSVFGKDKRQPLQIGYLEGVTLIKGTPIYQSFQSFL